MTSFALVLLALTPITIPVGNGYLIGTKHGTIARFQHGLGTPDFEKLLADARAVSEKKKPNRSKVLFGVVRTIDADWTDREGNTKHTKTEISDAELARCRDWFATYKEIVVACTGGAMEIDEDFVSISKPMQRLDEMGKGIYWLSPQTAFQGATIDRDKYQSVIVYYRPGDIPMGLLGGTYGKDYGVAGAAVSSLQIPEGIFKETQPKLNLISVATQHEWLHQMSFCAHSVMGYKYSPDCHSAEEYGWTDSDGGYKQWFAYNRDLMLRSYPELFWRTMDMRKTFNPKVAAVNAEMVPGKTMRWQDVKPDWERRLPLIDETFLRTRTGIPALTLSLKQYRPNDYCQLVIGGLSAPKVTSRIDEPTESDTKLNNILSMGRLQKGPSVDDPSGGYENCTLESMAVVRYAGPKGTRDLLFVRIDVAEQVLELLKTRGAKACDQVLGFVSIPDPTEAHPIVFIVAEADLGKIVPVNEISAIGRSATSKK